MGESGTRLPPQPLPPQPLPPQPLPLQPLQHRRAEPPRRNGVSQVPLKNPKIKIKALPSPLFAALNAHEKNFKRKQVWSIVRPSSSNVLP